MIRVVFADKSFSESVKLIGSIEVQSAHFHRLVTHCP
jgi:hypothetical protein